MSESGKRSSLRQIKAAAFHPGTLFHYKDHDMLFTSWTFFLFFPIVTTVYFLTPHRWRWMLLLGSSCAFYVSFVPAHILIAGSLIIVTYFAAIVIEKLEGRARELCLTASITVVCLILFSFKYYVFFAVNVTALSRFLDWNYSLAVLQWAMPVGLSFYTFQSISYLVEVHRGNQHAERHFGIYSLYIMFYPKLVAGPIERPQNLLRQLHEKIEFDYRRMRNGLQLAAWGFFKKVVIADRLARFVNPIYDHPQSYEGMVLVIATLFFTFELYCDFSGYTDIALGVAEVMGFKLQPNFDRPYSSRTLAEFWRRWHISLSTWLRDYLFEPIALKYRGLGTGAVILAILITFFICGLWHGSSWNYIIWGLLNGIMLCIELVTTRFRKRISKVLPALFFNGVSVFVTFSFVNFAFIFFRARTLGDAVHVVTHMTSKISSLDYFAVDRFLRFFRPLPGLWHSVKIEFLFCIALIAFLTAVHAMQKRVRLREYISLQPWWVRWPVYYAGALALAFFSVWPEKSSFIYTHF